MTSAPLAIAISLLAFPVAAWEGGASPAPETGIASWYGYPYHGRHSADGEIYDMEKLTAAHRTLPFGTRVRVVNLRNSRSVDVRITDRGPFVEGRIIDLSKAAARAVDLVSAGVGAVRLEVIQMAENAGEDLFAVQVGAFADRANAQRCAALMRSRYGTVRIVLREGDLSLWRVVVGSEKTQEGAHILATELRNESPDQGAFVVRLDP